MSSSNTLELTALQLGAGAVPANTVAPVVSGAGYIGLALSCTTGTWTNSPTSYAYQWQRAGVNIGGATSSNYTLVTADYGSAITCVVTATNGAGSGTPASSNSITASGVGFDAASSSGYEAALSTYSWTHTCSSLGSRFLVVGVSELVSGSVTGITYNGVALTKLRAVPNGVYRDEMWFLVAPASGAHSIVVTLSASLTSIGSAVSYVGVNQTSPFVNDVAATGTGNPASASVTTITDYDWTIDLLTTSDGSVTVGGGQTQRANNAGALGSGAMSDVGPIHPAGAQAMSWTGIGVADTWAYLIAALEPAVDPVEYNVGVDGAALELCDNSVVNYSPGIIYNVGTSVDRLELSDRSVVRYRQFATADRYDRFDRADRFIPA